MPKEKEKKPNLIPHDWLIRQLPAVKIGFLNVSIPIENINNGTERGKEVILNF